MYIYFVNNAKLDSLNYKIGFTKLPVMENGKYKGLAKCLLPPLSITVEVGFVGFLFDWFFCEL